MNSISDLMKAGPLSLVLVNLLPVIAVLVFDWDIAALVVLYWSENLIVGFFTLLKMLKQGHVSALFPCLFFCVHFGGFCAVHGTIILDLLFDDTGLQPLGQLNWPFFLIFVELLYDTCRQFIALAPAHWWLPFGALFISHFVSFVQDLLRTSDQGQRSVSALMVSPYPRIMILHFAILGGGFLITLLGQPLWLLVVLVIGKTVLDLKLYFRDERKLESHARVAT